MAIEGVGRVNQPTQAGRGAARAGTGFHLPARQAASASAPPPAAEVALSGMLALQEIDDADRRDREARRRGQDLLAELAGLQRAMLASPAAPAEAALHRLAQLAAAVPQAADPRLRHCVDAIVLRASVELARYNHDNLENTSPRGR